MSPRQAPDRPRARGRTERDDASVRLVLETRAPDLDREHDPGFEVAAARAERVARAAEEPIRVGAGEILVGTASWTDPTMTARGVFYPSDARDAEDRLAYYASRFPVVEVDATYYAIPARRTAELWVERTPPDFTFDVKAHALLTGQPTETRRLPRGVRDELPAELRDKPRIYAKDLPDPLRAEVWRLFAEGLEPLRDAGQLGAVLLQYPRWFFTSSENRDTIREGKGRLAELGLPVAVELRNASWFNEKNLERTLRFLEDERIPLVLVDAPQGYKSSVPPVVATTSPELSVVRFHGRRSETWERSGVTPVERFRYLYDRDELETWVPRVEAAAGSARRTHVLMNNCYANYGTTNALELAALLADVEGGGTGEGLPENVEVIGGGPA
ncbi:MAG TPA: DUF72 domain-containing protein [Candidatus Dormibacteraeota bacterium]|nr:DUF72 domain-containing protein [Candidatus Dormibacteraeota bacterium]